MIILLKASLPHKRQVIHKRNSNVTFMLHVQRWNFTSGSPNLTLALRWCYLGLSVQKVEGPRFKPNSFRNNAFCHAANVAACNSTRGMVSLLMGASQALAITMVHSMWPSVVTTRRYDTTPYAISDASAKWCSSLCVVSEG